MDLIYAAKIVITSYGIKHAAEGELLPDKRGMINDAANLKV